MSQIVLNISNRPVDLDTGRVIGPGEWAEDVDDGHPHNADLIEAGLLRVVDRAPVDTPRPEEGTAAAAPVIPQTPATPAHVPEPAGTETGGNA